jgi:hypothetical protein
VSITTAFLICQYKSKPLPKKKVALFYPKAQFLKETAAK